MPESLLALIQRADNHPALVDPAGDSVAFSQLQEMVERLGRQLVGAGLEPGDAVAFSLENGPEIILSFLAVLAAGGAAAPLNPGYTAAEFRAYLSDLKPRVMLVRGKTAEAARSVCSELGIALIDIRGASATDISFGAKEAALPQPDPNAVGLLLHTSGTTSKPKIVPLRHRNLAHSTRTIATHYALTPEDVSVCVMPLFHVHGLLASTLASLHSGGTVVVRRRFSPRTFWEDVVELGGTWYSAVPTIHQMLLTRMQTEAPPAHGLRFARSCSSALPAALQSALEDRLAIPVIQAYGMTEASHQMSSNPLPPGERRAQSVGVATGIEAGMVDDDWNQLAPGEVGEVVVRGFSVIDGYRDNPEANADSFDDGWFRTGDSGTISPDGYLTLNGRIKELINRAGEKISPHEVEDALTSHPSVSEAVAYAVPDERYGEQVAAAVVLGSEATPAELTRHCADLLAAFKVPVSITVLEAIPKGPTGKVQRRLLAGQIAT